MSVSRDHVSEIYGAMQIAHINIGSNTGDRRSLLERAVAGVFSLSREVGGAASGLFPRASSIVESEPWGFESENGFLNVGVEIVSDLPPIALLEALEEVERTVVDGWLAAGGGAEYVASKCHRNDDGTYRDRLLDIDLIFYGGTVMDSPRLILPHPRAHLRRFVMAPWAELSPGILHPVLNLSPGEILSRLERDGV